MNVLLVDDDRMIRQIGSRALQRLGGHDVLAVGTGREALEFGDGVDVILLDVFMDGMDGPETLRLLREAGVTAPVVFLTGRSDDPEALMALGAVGVIPKPFDPSTLASKLAALVPSP